MNSNGVSTVAIWEPGGFKLATVSKWRGSETTILKTIAGGVCGTDFHVLHDGGKNYPIKLPISLGHEILAQVVRVGCKTKVAGGGKLEVGDRVVVVPGIACGSCVTCLSFGAHEHLCGNRQVHGFSQFDPERQLPIGGFSTFIELLDDIWVHKVPAQMSTERAALGELVAIAVRAAERGLGAGRPEIGLGTLVAGSAAIIGLGPLGCCLALVLRSLGLDVTGFERDEWRAQYAKNELGITTTQVTGRIEDITNSAMEKTQSLGYDIVFESAGEPAAFTAAIQIARKGGRVVELGHFIPNGEAHIDPALICRKDLDVIGSVLAPPISYIKVMKLLSNPSLPFERVVTEQIYLDEINQIMSLKERGKFLKILVVPNA